MYKGYILIAGIVIVQGLKSSIGKVLSYRINLLLQNIQISQGSKINRLFLTTDGLALKYSYIASSRSIQNIQGSKYKALFTYYNVISDKFVRYFVISVAFCIKTPLPGPLQGRGSWRE